MIECDECDVVSLRMRGDVATDSEIGGAMVLPDVFGGTPVGIEVRAR